MTGKKDFESFDERKIPETFSFSESENTKQFLSEDFVFKFEDNPKQTGIDSNDFDLGVEDNETKKAADDNFDEIKDAASNSSSSESSEASSSSSSSTSSSSGSSSGSAASSSSGAASSSAATGASGTIATVAATVTTAVVLVVGGGLAIGQTIERPNICNLNDVVVVENKISFSLGVGRNQEEIDNDSGSECDVRVQLTCPGDINFLREVKTDHFGKLSGEFNELEYDTEYLLDVSQYVFLSAGAESLLEKPISVKTASKEVPPEPEPEPINSVNLYKDVDPIGGEYYYADLSIKNAVETYQSYYIGVIETSSLRNAPGDTGTSGGGGGDDPYDPDVGPGFIEYPYRTETIEGKLPDERLALETSGVQLTASSYTAALVGINAEKEETTLFSTEISPSQFVANNIRSDKTIYFKNVYDYTKYESKYFAYFAFDDKDAYVYNIQGTFTDVENPEEVLQCRIGLSAANKEEEVSLEALSSYGIYRVFDVTMEYVYNDPTTGEEIAESCVTRVDFRNIPCFEINSKEPTFNSAKFSIGVSATWSTQVLFVKLDYDDPDEVWSNLESFRFDFTNIEDEQDYFYSSFAEYPYKQFGETYYYLPDVPTSSIMDFQEKTYRVNISYDYSSITDTFEVVIEDTFTLDGTAELFYRSDDISTPQDDDPLTVKLHEFTAYSYCEVLFENVNDSDDTFSLTVEPGKTTIFDDQVRSAHRNAESGLMKTYYVTTKGYFDGQDPVELFFETIDFNNVDSREPALPTMSPQFSFGKNGIGSEGYVFIDISDVYDPDGLLDPENYRVTLTESSGAIQLPEAEIKTWPYDSTLKYLDFGTDVLPGNAFDELSYKFDVEINNGNYNVYTGELSSDNLTSQFVIPASAYYCWKFDQAQTAYLNYQMNYSTIFDGYDTINLVFSYQSMTSGDTTEFTVNVDTNNYGSLIDTSYLQADHGRATAVTVKTIGINSLDQSEATLYEEIINFSTIDNI